MRAACARRLRERLLLAEAVDVSATKHQLAGHEPLHFPAAAGGRTWNRGAQHAHLSGNMEDTIATAEASVEDEKVGTKTTELVMSMLTWEAASLVPTER